MESKGQQPATPEELERVMKLLLNPSKKSERKRATAREEQRRIDNAAELERLKTEIIAHRAVFASYGFDMEDFEEAINGINDLSQCRSLSYLFQKDGPMKEGIGLFASGSNRVIDVARTLLKKKSKELFQELEDCPDPKALLTKKRKGITASIKRETEREQQYRTGSPFLDGYHRTMEGRTITLRECYLGTIHNKRPPEKRGSGLITPRGKLNPFLLQEEYLREGYSDILAEINGSKEACLLGLLKDIKQHLKARKTVSQIRAELLPGDVAKADTPKPLPSLPPAKMSTQLPLVIPIGHLEEIGECEGSEPPKLYRKFEAIPTLEERLGHFNTLNTALATMSKEAGEAYFEKCRKRFEEELSKLPFSKIISWEPYKEELFSQFQRAPLKPDFILYSERFFAPGEIEAGRAEANARIPVSTSGSLVAAGFVQLTDYELKHQKIRSEFYNLSAAGTLPEDCLLPDVWATSMIKSLKKIDTTFRTFCNSAFFDLQLDPNEQPKIRGESILIELAELENPKLMNDIIRALLRGGSEEDTIRNIEQYVPPDKRKDEVMNELGNRWKPMQETFDLLLKKGMKEETTGVDSSIVDAPLCNCIQWIEDKYTGILNAAMKTDDADNPGVHWMNVPPIKENAAVAQYAGAYFLELISAEHKADCPTYRKILGNVEMSRQTCLIKKQGPKAAFEDHIKEYTATCLKLIQENEKRLMEYTGRLSHIGRPGDYWVRLNSIERLKMYETVGHAEILPNNLKQTETAPGTSLKLPAKFYAAYHWIMIEMGRAMPFQKTDEKKNRRKEIESFAKERYSSTSAQNFYKEFKGMEGVTREAIANALGSGYKAKLVAISGNDASLITHLKRYPELS